MTTIIDVDSHYEPRILDPDQHPLHGLGFDVPNLEQTVIQALAGDLWHETTPEDRARIEPEIPALRMLRGLAEDGAEVKMMATTKRHPAADDAELRVAWMDSVGIDFALVNPGGVYAAAALNRRLLPDPVMSQAAVRRCNDLLGDWVGTHATRLGPVTIIDTEDLTWSVQELERMRGRGSRAAMIRAEPFGGRSPAHPDNDALWEALASLGMVAVLHIGSTPAAFGGGWADAGWFDAGGAGTPGYLRFAQASRLEAAQKLLSALVFGGVFERVPELTVVLSELWAGWFPWTVKRLEALAEGGGALGPWEFSKSPAEFLRHNVKVTPLPGLGDDGMDVLAEEPDVFVFSSDFPHAEGNADPIAIYGKALEEQSDAHRRAFLGETMAEVFARMDDPLPIPTTSQQP